MFHGGGGLCQGFILALLGVCSVAEYQDKDDEDAYGGEEEASKVRHGEEWGDCEYSKFLHDDGDGAWCVVVCPHHSLKG